MRKDNTIFFLAGLVFGVWVGYFLFQSVVQSPAPAIVPGGVPKAESSAPPRRLLDPQEMSSLERMARDNPEDSEIRGRIGTLYMEAGNYQEAVRWFREATEMRGEDLHLRSHLAMSLAGLGRIDEAVSEYEAALALNPSHPPSLLGLGRVLLFGKNDIQGGIEAWNKLVDTSPESAEAESIREELEALKSAHSNN
jgi:tetratricopeptide (TPR) repeat protein